MRSLPRLLAFSALCSASAFATPVLAQWSTDTLPAPRNSLDPVTIGDYALFAGGNLSSFAPPSDFVQAYDAVTGIWSIGNMLVPRHNMGATVVGDLAMFAGGFAQGGHKTPFVDVYDISIGPPSDPAAWSVVSLAVPRAELAAATVGTKAMFAGGVIGAAGGVDQTDVVEIYDAAVGPPDDSAAWSTATLSKARNLLVGVTVGTKVLFAGGADYTTGLGVVDVDIYDDETGLWSTASLSVGRYGLAAATWGSRAYFGGGQQNVGALSPWNSSDVVDVYDAADDSWSVLHLTAPRGFLAAAAVGGKVVFAGGATSLSGESDVVDILDAASGTWDPPAQLSTARFFLAAATIHGKALFAGGGDAPAGTYVLGTDVVDAYEPCPGAQASEVVRLGTPPNPAALLPGVTSGPVVGATWDPVIDHTAFLPGALIDFLAVGLAPTNLPSPYGTILCGAAPLLILTTAPGEPFAAPIPAVCTHVGVSLCTQGGSVDVALVIAFTNALDIAIGTY